MRNNEKEILHVRELSSEKDIDLGNLKNSLSSLETHVDSLIKLTLQNWE